jgi:hypothetical protein
MDAWGDKLPLPPPLARAEVASNMAGVENALREVLVKRMRGLKQGWQGCRMDKRGLICRFQRKTGYGE